MRSIKRLATTLAAAVLTTALLVPATSADGEQFRTEKTDYGTQFQEILDTLRQNHVDPSKVKSDDELFKIAIDAMLKAIGDRHGSYFTPQGHQRFREDMAPTDYSGVGVKLAKGSGGLVILEMFRGSGLPMMGVHVGDVIKRARSTGGTDVTWDGNNIRELVGAIKGPAGTDVSLTVVRGSTVLGEITVQRVNTRKQYVFMKLEESGILSIKVTQFSNTIYDEISDTLAENGWLKDDGTINTDIIKGVSFDVRSNPGGSLKSSVQTAEIFMEPEKVVVVVIQPPNEESNGRPVGIRFVTEKPAIIPNTIPRVILANGFSASASEIVTGAFVHHKVMPFFGTKTYGKGSVQTVYPLPGGGAVKTTTAVYVAAGEMQIDGVGIQPNVLVQQPPAPGISVDHKRLNGNIILSSLDPEIDHQLAVAHAYLNSFISGGHSMNSSGSVQQAINKATGTDKAKFDKALCDAKGLRGCPTTVGFTGPPTH